MSKSTVFPYGITLKKGGKIDIFPAVEALFPSKDGEYFSLFLLVDSGAAISALPKSDALAIGFDAEKGDRISIGGIGNEFIHGWIHELNVKIVEENMILPIAFLDSECPRILGRAGIFERFTIIFEESKRRSGFLSQRSREARSIQKLLDNIFKK